MSQDDEDCDKKQDQEDENSVVLLKLKAIQKNFGKLDKFQKFLVMNQKYNLPKYNIKYSTNLNISQCSLTDNILQSKIKLQWAPSKQYKTNFSLSKNAEGILADIHVKYKLNSYITTNFSLNNKKQGSAKLTFKDVYQEFIYTINLQAQNKDNNPYKWGFNIVRKFQHYMLFTDNIPLQFSKLQFKIKEWKPQMIFQNFNQMNTKLKFSWGLHLTTGFISGIGRIQSPESEHMWCVKINKKFRKAQISEQLMYLWNPNKQLKIGGQINERLNGELIFENQIKSLNNVKINMGINTKNFMLKLYKKFKNINGEFRIQYKFKQSKIGFIAWKLNF